MVHFLKSYIQAVENFAITLNLLAILPAIAMESVLRKYPTVKTLSFIVLHKQLFGFFSFFSDGR